MSPIRQVILALTISGLVYGAANGLGYVNDQNGRRIENPLPKLGGYEMVLAWSVIVLTLTVLAEVPATGELAVSFAWLVLLAMLFSYGIEAGQNLQLMMSGSATVSERDPNANPRHQSTRTNPVVE